MIEIKSATTHANVFINGKNLGMNLDPKKAGLSHLNLQFDETKDWLLVEWMGVTKIIGSTGWQDILPVSLKDFGYKESKTKVTTPPAHVFQPGTQTMGIGTAQVETPHSKVQEPHKRTTRTATT